jgi:hypothetical protein
MNKRRFLLDLNALVVMAMLVPSTEGIAAQELSSTNGVRAHMVVSVEARHGSDVPLINREEVMVYEGHERDEVSAWVPAQGDHAGLELFILLDDASAVSLGPQLEDLRHFINSQPASTKIGVAYMQNGIARIEENLTSDHGQAAKGLRLPLGISGINGSPYFSLGDLLKHWPETSARREVLMVSDGIDRYYGGGNLDDPYVASAIEEAQRAGVLVFAIYTPGVGHYGHSYWRSYWGQLYLSYVADQTGGEGYYIGFTGPPVSFVPYLDDLSHRLSHQYLLTFLAKPQKKAGLQQVKVRTEIRNAELVAAARVYVPAGS